MQPVHEQQAGDQLVGGEGIERGLVEPSDVGEHVEHPLEAGAVQVRDERDQVLGTSAGDLSTGGAGVQQGGDPLAGRGQRVCLSCRAVCSRLGGVAVGHQDLLAGDGLRR